MYYLYFSKLEFSRVAHNQAAAPSITRPLLALVQSTTTFKASRWIIFKDYSARCIVKKANENGDC